MSTWHDKNSVGWKIVKLMTYAYYKYYCTVIVILDSLRRPLVAIGIHFGSESLNWNQGELANYAFWVFHQHHMTKDALRRKPSPWRLLLDFWKLKNDFFRPIQSFHTGRSRMLKKKNGNEWLLSKRAYSNWAVCWSNGEYFTVSADVETFDGSREIDRWHYQIVLIDKDQSAIFPTDTNQLKHVKSLPILYLTWYFWE